MHTRNMLFLALLLTFSSNIAAADRRSLVLGDNRYLVGISEVRQGLDSASRSIETPVFPGKEFYVRSVIDGFEILFRGTLDVTNGDSFTVEYFYKRSDLRPDASPPDVLDGKVTLKLKELTLVNAGTVGERGHAGSETKYGLSIAYFQPVIGLRYPNSSWSVRLIDEAGQPVGNAQAVLCDHRWEVYAGPFKSDTNGVMRIDDFRELLPLYTFVAQQRERDLFALANFDRNRADKTLTVTMRKGREKPKGFQPERVFK